VHGISWRSGHTRIPWVSAAKLKRMKTATYSRHGKPHEHSGVFVAENVQEHRYTGQAVTAPDPAAWRRGCGKKVPGRTKT